MNDLSDRIAYATGVAVSEALVVLRNINIERAMSGQKRYYRSLNTLDTFIGAVGLRLNSKVIGEIKDFKSSVLDGLFGEFMACVDTYDFNVIVICNDESGEYRISIGSDSVCVNVIVNVVNFTVICDKYKYSFESPSGMDFNNIANNLDCMVLNESYTKLACKIASVGDIRKICDELDSYLKHIESSVSSLESKFILFRDKKRISCLKEEAMKYNWLIKHLQSIYFGVVPLEMEKIKIFEDVYAVVERASKSVNFKFNIE